MNGVSTPAIILRRIEYGEFDLIATLFTPEQGKVSVMAKSAKKSLRRFPGILEPLAMLRVVYNSGRGKGLPMLQEAVLDRIFLQIRSDIVKNAYASYWAELIHLWLEDNVPQRAIYDLFVFVLQELEEGRMQSDVLSVLFQLRFLILAGFAPQLESCSCCGGGLGKPPNGRIRVSLNKGGAVCRRCGPVACADQDLSPGTIKQLQWLMTGDLAKSRRIRFSPQAAKEGLSFLERFVPYYLGKQPKSLKFINQIRRPGHGAVYL
jgi:DNA repair protein RecO (recombination protein O)